MSVFLPWDLFLPIAMIHVYLSWLSPYTMQLDTGSLWSTLIFLIAIYVFSYFECRSLGVHCSKVRSLTLDSWEPELLKVRLSLRLSVDRQSFHDFILFIRLLTLSLCVHSSCSWCVSWATVWSTTSMKVHTSRWVWRSPYRPAQGKKLLTNTG